MFEALDADTSGPALFGAPSSRPTAGAILRDAASAAPAKPCGCNDKSSTAMMAAKAVGVMALGYFGGRLIFGR